MADLTPLLLERKIVPKVWGGRALQELLGIELPGAEPVGETWELFDRPEGSSGIRSHDTTLRQLLDRHEQEILGAARPTPEGRFPLALKFLDAGQALSVQVHPDDDQAGPDDSGKPEAWLVLHAGARARVARGFREGVTAERFAELATSDAVIELLETFAPERGDCISVPPGTVHTIGPDVVVFEIQRNSDVTYRIYDWGRDRGLHVEQGLRAARFDRQPERTVTPRPIDGGGEWLLREKHFGVQRFAMGEPRSFATEGSFRVLTLLAGRAMVGWKSQGEHDPVMLKTADSLLVPACVDEVFVSPVGQTELVVTAPGEGL